jgi:hypothetical protein
MQSPGILRSNKQVSVEALETLHRKHVVIWKPPRIDEYTGLGEEVVMHFISRMTLSTLHRCTFELPDEPPFKSMHDYGFSDWGNGGEEYTACFWVGLMRICFREWANKNNLKEMCIRYGEDEIVLRESINKFVSAFIALSTLCYADQLFTRSEMLLGC